MLETVSTTEVVLGRPEKTIDLPLHRLRRQRILVTGAAGSVGQALVEKLMAADLDVIETDIDTFDVRRDIAWPTRYKPALVFHLAGAKHAPDGELDPWAVVETNTIGARNILGLGGKMVLASTCKAADPETAYGASKLLAERMVLNAGGAVARFYNVVETSGNVFETWGGATGRIEVTDCNRYFISIQETVGLLVWAAALPSGRYAIGDVRERWMPDVARDLYPARERVMVERRRGDRAAEPLHARSERIERLQDPEDLVRITSPHDPVQHV